MLLRRLAAAPLRRLRVGVVCYFGGLPLRAGGTKGEVSPRLSLRESLTPQSRCASHLAAPPPSLTFRRLHEVLAWVCCFGGWRPRHRAASARAWCAASAAYGCALAGQKGRFPLDFHFVKVSPLSPAARRTSLRRLRRLRFAVFMRCLPGCAASAVGGRVVQSASAKSIHWIDS
ncbi:hypothetical protein [Mobiluncus mulieris]|uniref:hypothetical protein n=1 Tax=Mobiluncus mulieris TaxID=2052 RepID=UPI0021E25B45|nr:hypothetical protein [Mobiluncus mulieris]